MKLRRIVVGVDFCDPSVAAARWTATELSTDAEIVLVHVVDLPRPPRLLRGALAPAERVEENAVAGARARLAELGPWVDGVRVTTEVVVGRAADRLVEAVDTRSADLLVVGEHGSRKGAWELLGSTAERVIRMATVPVLVARDLPAGPPRRILVAVDESSGGRRALRWGAWLGRRLKAEVVAVHALDPVAYATVEPVAVVLAGDPLPDALRADALRWLDEEVRDAGALPELAACEVVVGEPADEILAAVGRERADLVVLGSHGVPAPMSGILGGVARTVLYRAPVPVLVLGPLGR